ncbi:MAG: SRPBCC family protein [Actinomycetota bacterium]|nr:SRPBCC family protein [Actinomycetota bacterium]
MTTKVDKSITVDVPIDAAYNQWTQFEEFPQFMGGISSVTQLDDRRLHWVAEIAGVKREWEATILEQIPNEKIAWAATSGATNAGAVYFTSMGPTSTSVALHLEYEPEGLIENAGDKLDIVAKRAQADLEKFKSFIEGRGMETGAWRGGVNEGMGVGTPGVQDAAASQGDSGKAGLSAKTVAAGAAAAVAGVAAAGTMKGRSGSGESEQESGTSFSTETTGTSYPTETTGTETTLIAGSSDAYPTSIEEPPTPVAAPIGFESPETVESAEDLGSGGRTI